MSPHVQNDDPAGPLKKEFGTGSEEAHDKTLLTLSGNSMGNVEHGDKKFHGYDKNEKQNKY